MRGAALVSFLMLVALPVYAQMPEDVLDKDYQTCMAGDSDPQRAEYCSCVRDTMRGWDPQTYQALAKQEAGAANGAPIPDKITELAKTCIAKVLH